MKKFLFWGKTPQPEPPKERGYFDTVASADMTVRTIGNEAQSVTTATQAMKLATVYRCVSVLSGSIAALPLQLKRKRNGYFSVDEANPLNYLLTVSPNPRQTAFEFIRNSIVLTFNQGNAFIYPDWKGGELKGLVLLSPYSVAYDKMLNLYMVNDPVNNIYKTLECDEIIHLRNMTLDGGYTGESTIRYAARIMSVAASADAQSLDMFQPGNTYSGFISGEDSDRVRGYGEAQDDQLKDVSDRVEKELQSGKKIFSIPGSMRFNQLSMSPADIQLLEKQQLGVFDLCRFFGVHPDKVFAGQSTNYKASEMSQVQFMTDTLQPLLRQIQNEFFVKLIPQSVAHKYRLEFDLDAFYQTDLETMAVHMEKCIQYGVYTVNEWRMKKGLPAVDGGEVAMMSCNVAAINSPKIKGESVKNEKEKN
ncbi:phage portal protein [Bacteroides reticulotermitis]|uniref:phage portal protein n=1 Tax=Bacteroides reticulotermitis TaxID=1133319 RepID=UPI003A873822